MRKNKEVKLFEGNVNVVKGNRDLRNEIMIDILRLLENYKPDFDVVFSNNEKRMLDVIIRYENGKIYKRIVEEDYNQLKIERYFEDDCYPETYHWDLIGMDKELILEQI